MKKTGHMHICMQNKLIIRNDDLFLNDPYSEPEYTKILCLGKITN